MPEETTRFVPVPDADALDDWLPRAGLALLFLHDPGCPISLRAYWEVAQVGDEVALIDVRAAPALAGEVERRTGVRHESPQAIALRDGRPVWTASHGGVTARAIARATGTAEDGPAAPDAVRGRWLGVIPRS